MEGDNDMQEFSYEYIGSKKMLLYRILNNEQINHNILGALKDNRIHGLSPVMINDNNEGKELKYDVSGKVSLEQYFSSSLNKEQFMGALLGIVNPIQEASKYMVRIENITLDAKNIFVDSETHLVSLICLPLTRNISCQDLPEFFKSIIVNASFDSDEDIGYVARLINFLNSNAGFSMNQFKLLIEELSGDNKEGQSDFDKESKVFKGFSWLRKKDREKNNAGAKNKSYVLPTIQQNKPANKQISVTGRLQGSVLRIEPMLNGKVVLDRNMSDKPFIIREKNNERIAILSPEFRIGSDQNSVDYFIGDNSTISRNHAMILTFENKFYLIDNNSTNRTYLNGKLLPYHHEVALANGSKITLSNEEFYFQC